MITVIETADGRILVTDKEDVAKVVREAQKAGVSIDDFEDFEDGEVMVGQMLQSKSSYVLISRENRFED